MYWDRALPGFGVRVYATGSKVYIVQFRVNGRSKRLTLGRDGIITPVQARRRAARILARVQSGQPPLPEKAGAVVGPTVAEVAQRFLSEHVDVRYRPQTIKAVHRLFNRFILPAFGTVPAEALRCDQVTALHERLRHTPRLANYVVDMLSAMFKRAEAWRMVPDDTNPCTGRSQVQAPRAGPVPIGGGIYPAGSCAQRDGGGGRGFASRRGGDSSLDAHWLPTKRNPCPSLGRGKS